MTPFEPFPIVRRFPRSMALGLWVGLLVFASGCSALVPPLQSRGWENGYTIILPGIESRHAMHRELAIGLKEGGVSTAIEVDDWTSGNPAGFLFHLRLHERNQKQAARIANKIIRYQDEYPGRPIHLIGHSGGGGIAILTLEALPPDRQVDTTILLAAAISPSHPMETALSHCKKGLWNYSSLLDAPLLVAGTTVAGTIDECFEPSAGAIGFYTSDELSQNTKALYSERLHEERFQIAHLTSLNLGGHYGTMNRWFAKEYLAKHLLSPSTPFPPATQ